jgi:hypothetical protein
MPATPNHSPPLLYHPSILFPGLSQDQSKAKGGGEKSKRKIKENF